MIELHRLTKEGRKIFCRAVKITYTDTEDVDIY